MQSVILQEQQLLLSAVVHLMAGRIRQMQPAYTLSHREEVLQGDLWLGRHGREKPVCSRLGLGPGALILQFLRPHEALHQHLHKATLLAEIMLACQSEVLPASQLKASEQPGAAGRGTV